MVYQIRANKRCSCISRNIWWNEMYDVCEMNLLALFEYWFWHISRTLAVRTAWFGKRKMMLFLLSWNAYDCGSLKHSGLGPKKCKDDQCRRFQNELKDPSFSLERASVVLWKPITCFSLVQQRCVGVSNDLLPSNWQWLCNWMELQPLLVGILLGREHQAEVAVPTSASNRHSLSCRES